MRMTRLLDSFRARASRARAYDFEVDGRDALSLLVLVLAMAGLFYGGAWLADWEWALANTRLASAVPALTGFALFHWWRVTSTRSAAADPPPSGRSEGGRADLDG